MTLLKTIERHLRATGIPPSRFGREAVGDPRLVQDLRQGREVRPAMAARLHAYIAAHDGAEA